MSTSPIRPNVTVRPQQEPVSGMDLVARRREVRSIVLGVIAGCFVGVAAFLILYGFGMPAMPAVGISILAGVLVRP